MIKHEINIKIDVVNGALRFSPGLTCMEWWVTSK